MRTLPEGFVRPADLAVSYGLQPGIDNPAPEYQAALAKVVSSCHAKGIMPGIHCAGHLAATRAAQGFRMITASADFGAVSAGMRRDLNQARQGDAVEGTRSLY